MPAESTGQLTKSVVTLNGAVAVTNGTNAGSGRLNAVLCTTAITGAITVYDSISTATGTIIGYVASGAAIGTFQAYDIPYSLGIAVSAGAAVGTLTVVYTQA